MVAIASMTAGASWCAVLAVVGWGYIVAEVAAAPPVTGSFFEVGACDSLVIGFSVPSFSVFLIQFGA